MCCSMHSRARIEPFRHGGGALLQNNPRGAGAGPDMQGESMDLAVTDADVAILRFAPSPEEAVAIIVNESATVTIDQSATAQAQ